MSSHRVDDADSIKIYYFFNYFNFLITRTGDTTDYTSS